MSRAKTASERDELRERARKAFPAKYPDADAVVAAMVDFAAAERDRAWNEAREDIFYAVWKAADAERVPICSREYILRCIRALCPQPVQQDDHTTLDSRRPNQPSPGAGVDPKPLGGGPTPAEGGSNVTSAGSAPAPFDVERRARELFDQRWTGDLLHTATARDIAIALAREAHAAGAREKAEEIARELDARFFEIHGVHFPNRWAEIARSHARPPEPAPETRGGHPGAYDVIRYGDRLYRHSDDCYLPAGAEMYRRRWETRDGVLPEEFWSFPRWSDRREAFGGGA